MGHIDPTKEVFAQFKANDRPGPIHMLNLVRLREQAAYPDGRKATGAGFPSTTGATCPRGSGPGSRSRPLRRRRRSPPERKAASSPSLRTARA